MEKENNWIENKEINFKEDEKFKLDANMIIAIGVFIIAILFAFNAYTKYKEQKEIERIMRSYTNMIGHAGLNAMNAQEQIKKSFESLRDYK